jgi:hypothetical protein
MQNPKPNLFPKSDPMRPATFADAAKISPTTAFDRPGDVPKTDGLTPREKADVLAQWEADAIAQKTATDDGMAGNSPSRLDEINRAQTELHAPMGTSNRQHTDANGKHDGSGAVADTTSARQGVTGHNVRYVLGWSLAGLVTAFIVFAIYISRW